MDFQFSKSIDNIKFKLINVNDKTNKRKLSIISSDNRIPCRSGCSGCCKRMIKTTIAEGLIIYDYLKTKNLWKEIGVEARKQLNIVKNSDQLSWFSMGIECPVLDKEKKTCRAYHVRPIMCASHFVKSDPALCDPHKNIKNNSIYGKKYEPLDFNDLVEEFLVHLVDNTKAYGILQIQLPIPVALLAAESINIQSGLKMDQIMSIMYSEL